MSLLRPMASLTGALLVRTGNASMAGWVMPEATPAEPEEPAPWPEGLRLVEKGQGRPSVAAPDSDAAAPFGADMRISFRVDAERHRRLRLAALQQGRSRQQLLVAALDAYLDANVAPLDA